MNILRRYAPHWWLIGLACLTRLITLGKDNLWYDESFTALVVKPTSDFWEAVIGDTAPPLWSIIQALNVRLFKAFAFSPFGFRLPAAILSIATVPLIFHIARRATASVRTATFSAALVAVMPPFVYFGQDGRMYALLTFAVLAAIAGAMRGNWYVFGFAGLTAVYTHNVGLIYIAVIALIALFTPRSKLDFLKMLISFFWIGLFWLPWGFVVAQQAQAVKSSFWLPPFTFLNGFQTIASVTVGWLAPEPLLLHVYVAAYVLSFLGLWTSRKWLRHPTGRYIGATIVGVPAAMMLASASFTNIMVFRGLLPIGTLLMIVWSDWICHLTNPSETNLKAQRKAIMPIFSFLLCILVGSYFINGTLREDLIEFAKPINEGWQEGDVVFFMNPTQAIQHWLYLKKPFYIRPSMGDVLNITDKVRRAFHLKETERPFREIPNCTVWVVTWEHPYLRIDEIQDWEDLLKKYPNHKLVAWAERSPHRYDSIYRFEKC